jgi:hypothetical protein
MYRYAANIKLGAQLFDNLFGWGWWNSIDTETLNMASGLDCMLGQKFGSFWEGMGELGFSTHDIVEHGFDVWGDDVEENTYALMDIAWIDEINARRGLTTDAA